MSEPTSQTNDNLEHNLEDDLPEKYRGKTAAEIARMHMEAEREKSRLANEVGQFRTVADDLLGLQRELREDKTRQAKKEPISADELFENPDDALERAVSANATVAETRAEVAALRRQVAQTRFEKDYPEYQKDITDPAFGDWVKANKIRAALGVAANNGDYEAASNLWSLWSERSQDLEEIETKKKEIRRKQERAGILEGSTVSGGDTEKTYSRADMMALHQRAMAGDPVARAKWNDPGYQAQRTAAYAEGRVK